jgi:hypothetical protein
MVRYIFWNKQSRAIKRKNNYEPITRLYSFTIYHMLLSYFLDKTEKTSGQIYNTAAIYDVVEKKTKNQHSSQNTLIAEIER